MDYLLLFYAVDVPMSALLILLELVTAVVIVLYVHLRCRACSVPLIFALAVGVLVALNLVFLNMGQAVYDKLSTEAFNQKVVKAIPEFKGTAHCEKEGLAVQGVYQFDSARLDDVRMTYKVELNAVLSRFKYACSKGYYVSEPRELGAYLKRTAQDVVKAQLPKKSYGASRLISAEPAVAVEQ